MAQPIMSSIERNKTSKSYVTGKYTKVCYVILVQM